MAGKKPGPAKGHGAGGRPKGSLNKFTEEQLEKAVAEVEAARRSGKRLGKDVLDEFMQLFAGMAASYQPLPPGTQLPADSNREPDETKFDKYAAMAVDCANKLAQYQSPRMRAVTLYEAPPIPIPIPQTPKTIEGKVIDINDPNSTARVYLTMVKSGKA